MRKGKYGKGLYQSGKIGNQWYNVVYARLYPDSSNVTIAVSSWRLPPEARFGTAKSLI